MHILGVMRADVIVLPEPLIDGDLSLFGLGEPFRIVHLVSQGSVEPFIVAIPVELWQ